MAVASLPQVVRRALTPPVRFGRDWLRRFAEIQGVDRAMALGGQSFTALIPLVIVYASVAPGRDGRDFSDSLVERFDLEGAAADSLREAFSPSDAVESGVTTGSAVLLLIAALSFTRALQRLYETANELPGMGIRGTPYGLAWLLFLAIVISVRPVALDELSGAWLGAATLAIGGSLWLATPYLLLARRIAWQRLMATAVLTTVGMTALGAASLLWIPRTVEASAAQFGVIGVAFALLSWLVAAGFVLVIAATGCAVVDERLRPERTP